MGFRLQEHGKLIY